MEPSKTAGTLLHARRTWMGKVMVSRGASPWLTFADKGSVFSIDGKEYTIARLGFGSYELSHGGQSIALVHLAPLAINYAGKTWSIKKTGLLSSEYQLDADGQVVGSFKRPRGLSLSTNVDIMLPDELPGEIQILLTWMYFFVAAGSTPSP